MFNRIDQYLKDNLEGVVFINLKDNKKIEIKGVTLDRNIPLPLPVESVVDRVNGAEDISNISVVAIVQGMIKVIGSDSFFIYNDKYKEFLRAFDENVIKIIIEQGTKYMQEGNNKDGLTCFKAAAYLDKENLDALYNYGRAIEEFAFEDEKNVKPSFEAEALEVFERIVDTYPEFGLGYYHLGFYYLNQGQFKKTEFLWKKALDLDTPETFVDDIYQKLEDIAPKIVYEEGYNMILGGKVEEGLEKLQVLEDKYPEWWNLLFFLGLGNRFAGNIQDALMYFKKADILMPDMPDIINEIGLCKVSIGSFKDGIKSFEEALKIKKDDPEIMCNLGAAYLQVGEIDDARYWFERVLEFDPEDEIATRWLNKINNV